MFDLNIRFQIASVIFCCIILFDFLRSKKIPTVTNRYFVIMAAATVINLGFDITTVYTITHMDTVPDSINRFAHRGLYLTIACAVECFYKYVCSLDNDRGSENRILYRLLDIPFAASVFCSLFLPFWFYSDYNLYAYSQGAAVTGLFICVGVQLVVIVARTIKNKISVQNKAMIITGICVWVAVCLIQLLVPRMLLTGLGITIMLMFVYLSFENPAEYVDHITGCYNKYAFDSVLRERIYSAKPFFIINVVFEDMNHVVSRFGYSAAHSILRQLRTFLSENVSRSVYLFSDNALAVFISGKEDTDRACGVIKDRLEKKWDVNGAPIMAKTHADVLEFPDFAHSASEVNSTLRHFCEYSIGTEIINYVDDSCISDIRRQSAVRALLREAIKNDGFNVLYQPIYSVRKKGFASAEALLRLKDTETIGFVSPDEFIPIAEKTGLISDIGNIVFEKVCRFISENHLEKMGIEYIEINISGIQAVNTSLSEQLSEILHKYNVPPRFINLEITETAAVQSAELMKLNFSKLRSMNCSLSLDDFGSGYSNLSKIADISYRLIKLDKSLIWSCFDDDAPTKQIYDSRVILNNVISMISQLSIEIVAEGVETEEQAEELASKGINFLQGYYYSRPLTEKDFLSFIREHIILKTK